MIHKGQVGFVKRIMGKLQKAPGPESGPGPKPGAGHGPGQASAVARFLRANSPLLVVAALAILIGMLEPWQSTLWRYSHKAVLAGEAWRLLSGHLVHLGLSHLLLNLAGLGLVMFLFGRGVSAAGWLWLLFCSWLVLAAGFLGFSPDIAWYVGLSGVLHGLILGGALLDRGFPCLERNILILLVVFKLLWEQQYGALPLTAEAAGGPVVVDAHWYGGIGGLLGGIIWRSVTRFRNSRLSRV